ncbi:MAG: MFS transporter [Pseudonocardiaceae bacterium]|nr:MFS transporter [Pseudonocardiaceae bacterium]
MTQQSTVRLRRRQVLSWALWDWGSASFNAVIVTFVFSVYLTSAVAPDEDSGSRALGLALGIAGVAIALLAPVIGARADRGGRRRRWLAVNTAVVVAATAGLFAVEDDPSYLLLGLVLIAVGSVFFEFAAVNYNAMLLQLAPPERLGRVSGFGWGMGYFGGVVALAIVLVAFVAPEVGLFGVTTEDGLNIRVVALFCALWFGLFALPVLLFVPEAPSAPATQRLGVFASYRALFARIARMWRQERSTLHFLLASAVYRDGLAAVFTFGGILAAGTFGFSQQEVIVFALAANVVAGLGCVLAGPLDDRLGPKTVVVAALVAICLAGILLLASTAKAAFWVGGLIVSCFVGPVQSASRSLLARLIPSGQEGETFGLYATTGRAVSFVGPLAFSGSIALFGAQRWGLIGILVVLAAGLILVLPLRAPPGATAARPASHHV